MVASPLLLPAPLAAQSSSQSIRVPNLSSIPDLNRYLKRARETCGKEPRIITESRPSTKPGGEVIGQHPERGTRVGCDATAVTLYVSAGPAPPELVVPTLIEPRHRAHFEQQASDFCNIPVRVAIRKEASPLAANMFLSQSPQQGGRYRCGAPISVSVSAGPPKPRAERKPPAKPAEPETPAQASPTIAPAATLPETATPSLAPPPPAVEQPQPAAPAEQAAIQSPSRPFPWLLAASSALLLAAVLMFALWLLGRRRAAARPATQTTPPSSGTEMSLAIGRPMTAAALGPAMPADGQPVTTKLKPVPIVADLIHPIDPVVDWIAATTVAQASTAALGGRGQRFGGGGETLQPLRESIARGLSQALLFELAPLLADAYARARDLPAAIAAGGHTPLAPHSVVLTIYPDFTVTAGGLPLFRIAPSIELRIGLDSAAIEIRGHSLEAMAPGPLTVSARVSWLGESRPVQVAARHADWPGSVAIQPSRLLHSLTERQTAGK
ncbi:hypothetical protein [Sandaracinobacteroides hominis]|uniref:hypothetical protein n=1 Tax=Sandaracinobacteroides hominis TaxID=2780086 RepID=UPI0018F7434D|nr:hypothetical protein [Sandaracinobacteroides hominis]